MLEIEKYMECKLPEEYKKFLMEVEIEKTVNDILFYGCKLIVERNETYEVKKYSPGYVTIGDDGGGSAIMLKLDNSRITMVDHGAMTEDCMEPISSSFTKWEQEGFPLPEE